MSSTSVREKIRSLLTRWEYEDSLSVVPFLIASFITAGVSILYTKLFFAAEEGSLWFIHEMPWAVSLLITVAAIFFSWYIPYRTNSHAGGSGIPQMLIANELDTHKDKPLIRKLIGLRVITLKIISSLIAILGGASAGQEGPTLQIASGIFYRIGEKSTKWIRQISTRSFILAGGASGLAAAFNTPLGGVAYALEELSKDAFNNFKTHVLWSVIITGLIVQTALGGYLYLGFPDLKDVSILTYVNIVGLAAITGLCGCYFGSILYWISKFREKITNPKTLIALNIFCGVAFWLSIYFININGVGGGKTLIQNILFKDGWATSSDLFIRLLGPFLIAMAGATAGLFAPVLALGAAMGSVFAQLLWTHNHHLLVMAGMIGFLTGFMRLPFTAFILMFEMTDRHSAILPMMVAAAVSAGISHLVQKHSFYETMKEEFLRKHKPGHQHPGSTPPETKAPAAT